MESKHHQVGESWDIDDEENCNALVEAVERDMRRSIKEIELPVL